MNTNEEIENLIKGAYLDGMSEGVRIAAEKSKTGKSPDLMDLVLKAEDYVNELKIKSK